MPTASNAPRPTPGSSTKRAAARKRASNANEKQKRASDALATKKNATDTQETQKPALNAREIKKRGPRLSMPSSINSSTHVKASYLETRRLSLKLSRQNSFSSNKSNNSTTMKENKSPEERCGVQTRSAKKIKKEKKDSFNPSGFMLFSPPNQQANHQRAMDHEEARRRRVEQNKNAGQLLHFDAQGNPLQQFPSPTKTLLQSVLDKFDSIQGGNNNSELDSLVQTLAVANESLQKQLLDTNTQWCVEKGDYLVETTKLTTTLEYTKQHAQEQLQQVEATIVKLEDQLQSVRDEKNQQERNLAEVTAQWTTTLESLRACQEQLVTVQKLAALEETNARDAHERNATLQDEIAALQTANEQMAQRIAVFESAVDEYETVRLPKAEQQLQTAMDSLTAKEVTIANLEAELFGYKKRVEDLLKKLRKTQNSEQKLTDDFATLDEANKLAVAELETSIAEKDATISNLYKQLDESQQTMAAQTAETESMNHIIAELKADFATQFEKVNSALNQTMKQLEPCEAAKSKLESMVATLDVDLEKERSARVLAEKKAEATLEQLGKVEQEREETRNNMQGLSEREVELQIKLAELDKELKQANKAIVVTQQERDDARNNMAVFDERENELHRKLREGDRVRRDLHARVMQLAGNIRVFVRVRPLLPGEDETVEPHQVDDGGKKRKREQDAMPFQFPGVYDRNEKLSSVGGTDDLCKNLIVATEPKKDRGGLSDRTKSWKFGFDSVFSPQHGQEDVWEATEPLIQSCVDGYNVTLFAYGQTGSGKTYTMLGESEGRQEGIIGRAVNMLFTAKNEIEVQSRNESTVSLSVELLEVYNEQVRDLLAPKAGPNGKDINLKVTSKEVIGNIRVQTNSTEDVKKVMALAQKRRCVKATASNAESSRSHMLFTIHFEVSTKEGTRQGKLNVCDLAGSERLKKSNTHAAGGALLKETQNINTSLLVLSNVIEKLQTGDRKNVPFRESKLTFLLKDSLGGNSKTLAIVCCNPLTSHFHESLCSLKFAEKVNKVELKAVASSTI